MRGKRDRLLREFPPGHIHPAGVCAAKSRQYRDYSDSIWGLTACDGPGDTSFIMDGKRREFHSYSARGVSVDWVFDDGTIAPTAAASSIPFAPEICISAVKAMARKYGDQLFRNYGFADAFNPTFITPQTPRGWFDQRPTSESTRDLSC